MNFTHEQLPDLYEGVRKGNAMTGVCYIFANAKGDFMELFVIDSGTEYRFVIDNYPRQRKFFSTNLPYRSVEDFEHDLIRTGVEIPIKKIIKTH